MKRSILLFIVVLFYMCNNESNRKPLTQSGLIESKIAAPSGSGNQKIMLMSEINKIANARVDTDSTTTAFMKVFDSTAMSLSTHFFLSNDQNLLLEEIQKTIFSKWKIQYCSADTDSRYSIPGCVFKRKKGSAVGITLLYLLFAEKLDLPLHAAKIGNHHFMVFNNGKMKFNIEPSKNGTITPDSWYLENATDSIPGKQIHLMNNDEFIKTYRQIVCSK